MNSEQTDRIFAALNEFQIETPSWGFADTGTRFGKFLQDGSAIDINDKLSDAAQVHHFTGCCPSMAVHVVWDFKNSQNPPPRKLALEKIGLKLGPVNPNLFQGTIYKNGFCFNLDASTGKPPQLRI